MGNELGRLADVRSHGAKPGLQESLEDYTMCPDQSMPESEKGCFINHIGTGTIGTGLSQAK